MKQKKKHPILKILGILFLIFLIIPTKSKESETIAKEIDEESAEIIEFSLSAPEISLSDIPEYQESAFIIINDNHPFFNKNELPTDSFEEYSELDNLGRCGVAFANISIDLMPTTERESIGSIKPSGWQTVNYHELIDGNYLYNRCHLIGYQLAGENANEKNLITGTRYLNVDGMLPFENQVADYVKKTNHHVLYRVTPLFYEDELVCRGVLIEAQSIEDDDCIFCVFCYNVQPNFTINYANGDSSYIEPEPEPTPVATSQQEMTLYILNANTHVIHYPSCSSVNSMKDKNKREYWGYNIDDLINQGYKPCSKCNPR